MRRPTVWRMMQRIRTAMAASEEESFLLFGIVEADETYVGGKPRKKNSNKDDNDQNPNKRGRGTEKTSVIGVVERGGKVVARVAKPGDLSCKGINSFIKRFVDPSGSLLITDQFKGYNHINYLMHHAVVNHAVEYVNGIAHTNTIEGFWSLIKRAWYGSHHHYSKKYTSICTMVTT